MSGKSSTPIISKHRTGLNHRSKMYQTAEERIFFSNVKKNSTEMNGITIGVYYKLRVSSSYAFQIYRVLLFGTLFFVVNIRMLTIQFFNQK